MTGELLPLFPLRAVLFPGSALPLHIFEDRYRVLVAGSIREEREFGTINTSFRCSTRSSLSVGSCGMTVISDPIKEHA